MRGRKNKKNNLTFLSLNQPQKQQQPELAVESGFNWAWKDIFIFLGVFVLIISVFNAIFTAHMAESLVKTEYQMLISQQLEELYRLNPDYHFKLDRKMLESLPDKTAWYRDLWFYMQNVLAIYLELLKGFC